MKVSTLDPALTVALVALHRIADGDTGRPDETAQEALDRITHMTEHEGEADATA